MIKFSDLKFSIFTFLIGLSVFSSCSSPAPETEKQSPNFDIIQKPENKRVPIDSSGYSIAIIPGLQIEQQVGADFHVYYFTPIDSTSEKGEAGIYFGPKPDQHPPSTDFSKLEIPGIFLGEKVVWIEYTTDTYKQRETFIDKGNGDKIHVWCYSNKIADLEELFTMVNSIQK